MKNKNTTIKIIVLFLLFPLAAGLYGQQGKSKHSFINADEQYFEGDKVIARGNVEIHWEEYRIYADYLEFNQTDKELVAIGRVTMSSGDTVISGEKIRFNLEKNTGEMYEVYGQAPPTIRYNTDKMTQIDKETLSFKKFEFTSCNQCVPRWKISCSKGKLKKEKYVEMSNVVFKIKKIPVFWLPYLRYPIDKDGRSTGFLFPGIGTSSQKGFYMQNAFFWAINKNADLTLHFDYYSKAGYGVAEELRYLYPRMQGNIEFYYFIYKEGNILEKDPSEKDYFLKMQHKQRIDFLNTDITVNIDRQSDANFLRLFSNDFDSVLRRTSRSSVSIDTRILPNLKFSARYKQNDTFFTFNNQSTTVKYLPEISVNLNQQKLWLLPGYFSLNTSYATVSRVGKTYDEEETIFTTDISSTRFSLKPSYTLSLMQTPWASATLQLQAKHTFYNKSKDPEDSKKTVDEALHLGYQSAILNVKGPVFSKIFKFSDFKLKHVIEPRVNFRYVTKVEDEDRDRLVPVDYFDYPTSSQVEFSMVNRLLLKNNTGPASAKEIFSHTISQTYYFDPVLANRNRSVTLPITEEKIYPEFSTLTNRIRLRPLPSLSFDAQLVYHHYLKDFTRLRLSINFTGKDSPIRGSFFYNSYVNQYAKPDYVFNRDTIGGTLRLDAPRFPIKLDARVNYDITDQEFRLGSFLLTYDFQCIQFKSELKLYRYDGRIETQFNIGIAFGNMGMVKDMLGTTNRK